MRKHLYFLFLILLIPCLGRANHIVGGNLEMVATRPTPGAYDLSLVLYFDEIGGVRTNKPNTITVSIFRKRDNARMTSVTLFLQTTTAVAYANPTCAAARSLQTSALRYYAPVTLSASLYNDSDGYYVAWERCCRNTAADNIVNPGGSGMVFYLAFPPLTKNGQSFLNSSPVFGAINGEYICLNKSFTFPFGATDADGDVLKYSMVTPYMGYSTTMSPAPDLPTGSSSYPLVSWQGGFSATAAIPGSPALQVNAATGVLTVKANQLGLFVFTVLVEEFRNGEKIGEVRRDFQLLVVDCPDNTLATPMIHTNTNPTTPVTQAVICEGGFIDLFTAKLSDVTYQWQKESVNIPGATSNTYAASEAGLYTVIISSSKICSESKMSEKTNLIIQANPKPEITSNVPLPTCATMPVTLSTVTGNYTYLWKKDADTLRGQTTASIPAPTSGLYSVRVQTKGGDCYYIPTKQVDIYPVPKAIFTSIPSVNRFCGQDSVSLAAFDSTGYAFQWYLNGQALPGTSAAKQMIRKSGIYTFQASIGNCKTPSVGVSIELYPTPVVTLDSIPTVCGTKSGMLTLKGTPEGGVFAGKGIVDPNRFDASQAGVGSVPITYTYKNQYGCQAVATRMATVALTPQVNVGSDFTMINGESVSMNPSSKDVVQFSWSPPEGLSSASIEQPMASPTKTIRYVLEVTASSGCKATDDVLITVWEKITIPNGITPNGDGKNDTWQLPGIEAYPDADVHIFNRWGTELFSSHGYTSAFDGMYKGEKLPPATYYYVIKPNNGRPTISGSLTILY